MNTNTQQTWFITGAGKGLGAAIAKEALQNGYTVVAARNPEAAKKELGENANLHCVRLDLMDEQSIQNAVQEVKNTFGRIDVLINNAGYGLLGYFEEFSDTLIRRQMETNVFGLMSLTRAVLPIMREQRSGWIVNFSSTSGIKSVEGGAVYSASKFAVEGFTEGLSIELEPFGIRCLLVEPGAFRTDFFKEGTSFVAGDIPVDAYNERRQPLMNHFTELDGIQPGDPQKLAKALLHTLQSDAPPLRLLDRAQGSGVKSKPLKNPGAMAMSVGAVQSGITTSTRSSPLKKDCEADASRRPEKGDHRELIFSRV